MLDSPLAAASRGLVYRRRNRERPRDRGLRLLAAFGTLLLHVVFLLSFVLGPAYQLNPVPESKQQFMQVRLIEQPEPPPPPGTPPKQRGLRHRGHVGVAAPNPPPATKRTATAPAPARPAVAQPAVSEPVTADLPKTVAPAVKPVAAPKPSPSPPAAAPLLPLQPIPLAVGSPPIVLPKPTLQPPLPPVSRPEPVRKPQPEGTRPLPSPVSLVVPRLVVQAPRPVLAPTIALEAPPVTAQAPSRLVPAPAPVVPSTLELPTPPAPPLRLPQTPLALPTASVQIELPRLQVPALQAAEAQPELVPLTPVPLPPPTVRSTVKIAAADQALQPPVVARPRLSVPPVAVPAPSPASSESAPAPATAAASPAAPPAQSSKAGAREEDVSKAPDATPQGSDFATPGQPDGSAAAAESAAVSQQPAPSSTTGKGLAGAARSAGEAGSHQAGAVQGERQDQFGDYVQLKPRGDTEIMKHAAPNIGYRPTRFAKDWTPEGESSIDTALRHAVEKTTVSHTFHLPRGVRVGCKVMPLLPIALFSCGNPDPPPAPVAARVYDRLHLAPANPLFPATAASVAPVPAVAAKLDNSAECAAARVSGGPLPPGCDGAPSAPRSGPAATSSSWVPASDQFH
jgi:hypothetical protein